MMILKSCREQACYEPWKSLHLDGRVRSLADADVEYDEFYRGQTKVQYKYGAPGYILAAEGPMEFNVWDDEQKRITPPICEKRCAESKYSETPSLP